MGYLEICYQYFFQNVTLLLDNKNSIGEILSIVQKELQKNIQQKILLKIFKTLYQSFLLYDLLLLTY